jgi:hypothetical protein
MQDPVTGVVKQSLSRVILGGIFVFVILIVTLTIFPYYSRYYLYISIPVGIFGFISLIWINVRPNLYARFFLNVCISVLSMVIGFRSFANLLPQFSFLGSVLIVITVTLAHTLPIWNGTLANIIREELSAPKTKLGKLVFKFSLAFIPFVGILCAMTESLLYRENKSAGLSFILVFLSLLVATILPYAYRFPSSPWEIKEK